MANITISRYNPFARKAKRDTDKKWLSRYKTQFVRDLIFYVCRVLSFKFKSLSMFPDVTSHSKAIAIDRLQSSSNSCVIFSHLRRNIASNVECDSPTLQMLSLFSQDSLSTLSLILENLFRSSYFVIFYVQSCFGFLIMFHLPWRVRRFLNCVDCRLRIHVGDNYGILSL